ncbi:TPA: ATP-binding protein [Vibrio parahaemolyticus]|uniref:ATP-binding protein n=1 Tax=Vibrio harveyi group TaxID=717610 RepID=UPI000B784F3E|nr:MULTISPECIES: ATP-binding protein [Vibrio harveyi group]EGQ7812899.1 ATP-binding protein [Vibrio parahaemolyticus]EGR2290128.1 ATP-binding protein [Vibrio parahaemolyticus]OXD14810.1 ATPase [Vibrio parahaemolyticus]
MRIGTITSVNFNQFKVKVSTEIRGNSVNLAGVIYYFGNIGSYLKTTNSVGEQLICEVVSIFDSDMKVDSAAYDVDSSREILLKPIGTITREGRFSLGVGIFPSIYSEVNIVTFEDMELILQTNRDKELSEKVHQSFHLGESKNLINYPIDISINSFFNIHTAVLGNSGSGKSNTIAHIIQDIHKKKDNSAIGSRILIFDVNGEYRNAFEDHQKCPNVSVRFLKPNLEVSEDGYEPFFLPHFLMNIDEWSAFLMATDATQRPFWDKVLQESYKFYMISTREGDERQKLINYLRFKICNLLQTLHAQGDSETAIITAAKSIIYGIRELIKADSDLLAACQEEGIIEDLNKLFASCTISFGENKDKLKKALEIVRQKVIDEDVREVMDSRAKSEEFFDYRFLKQAANMSLLEEDARGNGRIREYTSTMMTRLDFFLDNDHCLFMRQSPEKVKEIEGYLDWLWQSQCTIPSQTNMVIIDTSELTKDALETLTSVVSRLHFSFRKRLKGSKRREKPVHLVLDEAHRYIKKDSKYLLRDNIFEQIAREGRKYALYLLISSQRPSELSGTVLSQCSNFIIHRIQNEVDMNYVYSILPYFSDDFANKIKQSVPGEALVFGNCVSMPLHVRIQQAYPEPNSENCKVHEEWFKPFPALSTKG